MIAAAGADMFAVEIEFFRRQAGQARFFVQFLGLLHLLGPGFHRMDVDLDHAGVGGNGETRQPVVRGRQIALQNNPAAGFRGGVLDGGEQVQPVLHREQRRQEHVHLAVARFDGHRGADKVGLAPPDAPSDHWHVLRHAGGSPRSRRTGA